MLFYASIASPTRGSFNARRAFARGLIAPHPRRRMRRKDRLIARFDHARRALKFQNLRGLYTLRTYALKF